MLSPTCYSTQHFSQWEKAFLGEGQTNKVARCSFLLGEMCAADEAKGRGCQFGVPDSEVGPSGLGRVSWFLHSELCKWGYYPSTSKNTDWCFHSLQSVISRENTVLCFMVLVRTGGLGGVLVWMGMPLHGQTYLNNWFQFCDAVWCSLGEGRKLLQWVLRVDSFASHLFSLMLAVEDVSSQHPALDVMLSFPLWWMASPSGTVSPNKPSLLKGGAVFYHSDRGFNDTVTLE